MIAALTKNLLKNKALKKLGPFQIFAAGGAVTFAVVHGLKFLSKRSKNVEKVLNTGFDIVEDKIADLKGQVLPKADEGSKSTKE